MKMDISILKELVDFLRLKLCIFAPFMGMIGYLLFNHLSTNIIFVILISFFISVGGYAYNNITDREEDLINRKKINYIVLSDKSYLIVLFSFLIALLLSLFLPLYSIFFTIIGITVSTIYSLFKIKKYFLLKNIYTGFGATQLFLLGAGGITIEIIQHYLLIAFFIFIGSIISDLRDCEGDKSVGIKTLPVYFGYDLTKKTIYFLLIILSVLILGMSVYNLFPMLVFVPIMFFYIVKNKPIIAHFSGVISLIFLVAWSIVV